MPDHHPPIGEKQGKKAEVERMFDAIAGRYDLLNRVLSLGIDVYWRRRAVAQLKDSAPRRILDVATGTADLAVEASRLDPEEIIGIDIAVEMLRVGREKVRKKGLNDVISLQEGDSEALPFEDEVFDAAMVAFGVRNFENLQQGLAEIYRVLAPGGTAVILEFSHPRAFPIKQLYRLYSRQVLPRIGAILSRDSGAYTYLPESVAAFPDGEDFLERLRGAGFSACRWHPLTFGIASLYVGQRRA